MKRVTCQDLHMKVSFAGNSLHHIIGYYVQLENLVNLLVLCVFFCWEGGESRFSKRSSSSVTSIRSEKKERNRQAYHDCVCECVWCAGVRSCRRVGGVRIADVCLCTCGRVFTS